uniref:Uncharacterized protein n=1 Tax=Anguilla anguilla TaxID=7936 RepID=A0A0E9TNH6_ANGAN
MRAWKTYKMCIMAYNEYSLQDHF